MTPPFDEAAFFKLVDSARERNRLDFQNIGQRTLVNALVAREISHRLPLRPREPGTSCPLLEALSEKPGDIVKEETEGWRKDGRHN